MRFVAAADLIEEIDQGSLSLPRFQRSFVWKRPDIKEFIDSVYREYPVGALATWESDKLSEDSDGTHNRPAQGKSVYLLDGQQRLTSIYGVIRGTLPPFSMGVNNLMSGLVFHVKDRRFAYQGTKEVNEQSDGLWVEVTRLFRKGGMEEERSRLQQVPGLLMGDIFGYSDEMNRLVERLNKVSFPVLELTDANLTVEDVVNIFNKMNKGGKKLTPYELAFSVLSANWAEVRQDFQNVVDKWQGRIDADADWLLRVVNAVVTGSGRLSIEKVPTAAVRAGLRESEKAIDHLLNILGDRLGLDYPRVLKQRLPFAVMASFVVQQNGRIQDPLQRDKLLYWYVLSSVFGTYLRAPESRMTRDLNSISGRGMDGLDALIESLRVDRPDLKIVPSDLDGTQSASGFFMILYMLTRVYGARDWQTGETIREGMLGKDSKLEMHHIFPKSLLAKSGVQSKRINNLANFAFQTSFTNKSISNQDPADYLREVEVKQREALESQWIPMDRRRWQISEYESFLEARRERLANAANDFLDALRNGKLNTGPNLSGPTNLPTQVVEAESDLDQQRAALVTEFQEFAPGIQNHPIAVRGENSVQLDVAWPDGLQFGISEPIAFLFDPDEDIIQHASQAGFKIFTDLEQLRSYARVIEEGDLEIESD